MALPDYDWWKGNTGMYIPGGGIIADPTVLGLDWYSYLDYTGILPQSVGECTVWSNDNTVASTPGHDFDNDISVGIPDRTIDVVAGEGNAPYMCDAYVGGLKGGKNFIAAGADLTALRAITNNSFFVFVKFDTFLAQGCCIAALTQYSARHVLCCVDTDGSLCILIDRPGASAATAVWTGTAGDVVVDEWSHIVWEHDGSVAKAYVNGVEKSLTYDDSADPTNLSEDQWISDINLGVVGCSIGCRQETDATIVTAYGTDAKYLGGGLTANNNLLGESKSLQLSDYWHDRVNL